MSRTLRLLPGLLMLGLVALPLAGRAGEAPSERAIAQEDRIAELERTVGVLADELERTRSELAGLEEPELGSQYGLGPAASQVYGIAEGLSIGGYGEINYRHVFGDAGKGPGKTRDQADALRGVLYVGYKFTDNIIFNSEIEFEHGSTSSTETSGAGSVSLEFAALDFLWKDWVNFRAGLLLMPMGFLNEIHEPPFFYGVLRPSPEQRIIPTTWRENGVGLFGSVGESLQYNLYVVNGLNAEGFDSSGVRGGRQKANRALAEHLGVVGSVDWTPIPELLLGGSVYHGSSGQNQTVGVTPSMGAPFKVRIPDVPTTIWEAHGQFRSQGLHLRALFTMAHLGNAGSLSSSLQPTGMGGTGELSAGEAVAKTMMGAYGEIAYEIFQWLYPETGMTLEPFFRYEFVDTQHDMPSGFAENDNRENHFFIGGLHFQPIPQVVLKGDVRIGAAKSGAAFDSFNLGIGYVF